MDGGHEGLLSALGHGAVDVAIMTNHHLEWVGHSLPLWSERLIAAVPESHRIASVATPCWDDLSDERILLPQSGPGPELERLLVAQSPSFPPQRILRHDAGLDRLLSLVGAEYGILLMLEGATGVRCEGVAYREVIGVMGPTRLNFCAYWKSENANPTLLSFLTLLRERYPDLSGDRGLV